MEGQALESIETEKDLGVYVSNNLKPASQCSSACAKGNRMLGLVKRTIQSRDPIVLLSLYKSLVRPHLEYCCSAWNPYYEKNKCLLEKVQHRFTRLFPGLRHLSYRERLAQLKLWSLEERRNRADLIEVFKLFKGFTNVSYSRFFQLAEDSRTRGHTLKICKPRCKTDLRKYFFACKVINRWNSLPEAAIQAESVNSFKNYLQRIYDTRIGFFLD